jgi:sugar lactone lactonase YvrE
MKGSTMSTEVVSSRFREISAVARSIKFIERTRPSISLAFEPGSLWRGESRCLFIADNSNDRIWRWDPDHGLRLHAALPRSSTRPRRLGQIVADGDGLIVPCGRGGDGGLARISVDGSVSLVPDVDPRPIRGGLSRTADGRLVGVHHLDEQKRGSGTASIIADDGERILLQGMTEPVGVIAVGDELFITDQEEDRILCLPLFDPTFTTVFATLPRPGVLTLGPSGTLLVASDSGSVYVVDAQGRALVLATGFETVHGIAYDGDRRIFIAECHWARAVRHGTLHVLELSDASKKALALKHRIDR